MEFNLAFSGDGQPVLKSACGRCRELLPDESVVKWLMGEEQPPKVQPGKIGPEGAPAQDRPRSTEGWSKIRP